MTLICVLLFASCGNEEADKENIFQVYYVSNSETKVEAHPHTMEADTPEAQLKELVECLSTNPEKLEYKAPLNMGFQVLNTKLEDGKLQIDVDGAYKKLPVTTEVLVRAAIAVSYTHLTLPTICSV